MQANNPLKIKRAFDIGIVAIVALMLFVVMALSLWLIEQSVDKILFEKAVIRVFALAREAGSIIENGGTEDDLQEFVVRENNTDDIIYAIVIDKNVTAIAHSEEAIRYRVYKDEYTVEGVKYGRVQNEMWYSESLGLWGRDIMVPIYVNSEYYGIMDVGMIPDMGTSRVIYELLRGYFLICVLGILIIAIAVSILTRIYLVPVLNAAANIEKQYQTREESIQRRESINDMVSDVGQMISIIDQNINNTSSGSKFSAETASHYNGPISSSITPDSHDALQNKSQKSSPSAHDP